MDAVSLSYKEADKAECWSSRNDSQGELLIRPSLAGRRAVQRMLGGECLLGMVTPQTLLFLEVLSMKATSFFVESILVYIFVYIYIFMQNFRSFY